MIQEMKKLIIVYSIILTLFYLSNNKIA